MSEYQCYQWRSVGRSLSAQQSREVFGLSSHISVSSNSAEVTYHWGDFKHDPHQVLARYYDIFLYEANWGMQEVAFRFDSHSVNFPELKLFALKNSIQIKQSAEEIFVKVLFDENWPDEFGYYDVDDDDENISYWRLDAFEALYRQVQEGDCRSLFLLWLKGCELAGQGTQQVNLPQGLTQLGEEHETLIDFIGVHKGLLEQAQLLSKPLPKPNKRKKAKSLVPQLSKLSAQEQQDYLKRLLEEDAHAVKKRLQSDLLKRSKRKPISYLQEPIGFQELHEAAEKEAEIQAQKEAEAKQRRREEYLRELRQKESQIWDKVDELIAQRKSKFYDEAMVWLRGLEDLYSTRQQRELFVDGAHCLLEKYPTLTGVHTRMAEAGFIEPKKRNQHYQWQSERWQEANPLEKELNLNYL